MAQPISQAKEETINSEVPRSAAAGHALPTLFKSLYEQLNKFRYGTPGSQQFLEEDTANRGALSLTFFTVDSGVVSGGAWWAGVTKGTERTTPVTITGLTDNATNYVELQPNGNVVANTSAFSADKLPLYEVVTSGGAITGVTDKRPRLMLLNSAAGQIDTGDIETATMEELSIIPTFTVNAEGGNVITVDVKLQTTGELNDAGSQNHIIEVWLSDSATGWETSTAPDTSFTVTTGTQLGSDLTTDKRLLVQTVLEDATISIGESGVATWYLGVIVHAQTTIATWSGAITFA